MKLVKSELVKEVVEIGRKNRKTFRPLEARGVITEPVYNKGWWFVPLDQDKSVIPQEALRRVEILQKEGVQIKDMVVAHEAPLSLMAPKKDRQIDHHKREVSAGIVHALMYLASGVGFILGGLSFLVLSSVFIDPCLIVVLEDGTWVEVCAWDESFG